MGGQRCLRCGQALDERPGDIHETLEACYRFTGDALARTQGQLVSAERVIGLMREANDECPVCHHYDHKPPTPCPWHMGSCEQATARPALNCPCGRVTVEAP